MSVIAAAPSLAIPLLKQCAWCNAIKVGHAYHQCRAIGHINTASHGICPECAAKVAAGRGYPHHAIIAILAIIGSYLHGPDNARDAVNFGFAAIAAYALWTMIRDLIPRLLTVIDQNSHALTESASALRQVISAQSEAATRLGG